MAWVVNMMRFDGRDLGVAAASIPVMRHSRGLHLASDLRICTALRSRPLQAYHVTTFSQSWLSTTCCSQRQRVVVVQAGAHRELVAAPEVLMRLTAAVVQ